MDRKTDLPREPDTGGGNAEITCQVTFMPMNKTVQVKAGTSLLDIAMEHDIELEHNCGGNCSCGTCHVLIREGMSSLPPISYDEQDQLDMTDDPTPFSRLACQSKISGDIVLEIPAAT